MGFISDTVLRWRSRNQHDFGLGRVGVWLQDTSIDNPLIWDADWFICQFKHIDKVRERSPKPIFAAISTRTMSRCMDSLIAYRTQIRGLIWDYEVGATYEEATATLQDAYRTCKSMGLSLGVVAVITPDGSLSKNGVKYQDAKKWCDFLVPLLYSQWSRNRPQVVRNQYLAQLKAASVPLIPAIAHKTTSPQVGSEHELLTVDRYRECYGPLKLPCFVVWNVDGMKKGLWAAVKGTVS